MILIVNYSYSQNKEFIYVKIENSKGLYSFEKTKDNKKATIKILYSQNKEKEIINHSNSKNRNDSIIIVEPIPQSFYYKFESTDSPIETSNLKNIKSYSIEDISKHRIWNQEYPHTIYFIETINKYTYLIWKMNPKILE